MLYDNGGHTPPMPPQRPVYQQPPQSQAVPSQRPQQPMGPYRPQSRPIGPPSASGPQYPMFQQSAYSQAAPQQTGNMQQPMYGQQQFPWMQKRRRFLGAYGAAQGGGMYGGGGGMPERDVNGNSPGEWDYQQSQQQYRAAPMPMYAR